MKGTNWTYRPIHKYILWSDVFEIWNWLILLLKIFETYILTINLKWYAEVWSTNDYFHIFTAQHCIVWKALRKFKLREILIFQIYRKRVYMKTSLMMIRSVTPVEKHFYAQIQKLMNVMKAWSYVVPMMERTEVYDFYPWCSTMIQ